MAVINPLIISTHLTKVQNETGRAIERDLDGVWYNDIGTFDPDEGYKVRLSAADALTIDPDVYGGGTLKSTKVPVFSSSTLSSAYSKHFKPIWEGNGLDHMNIYIYQTQNQESSLKQGDEIGIFDGSYCVGSGVIKDPGDRRQSIVVSVDDPTTQDIDGFITGNDLSLKIWRSVTNAEVTVPNPEFLDESSKTFEPMGTSRISIDLTQSALNPSSERTTGLGDNFPNPFTGKTTIPFTLGMETAVDLTVYDMLGSKVNTLVHATLSQGSHSVEWNADNNSGVQVNPGVYYIRLTAGNKVFTKAIVLINN